jgi:hypothetical protein
MSSHIIPVVFEMRGDDEMAAAKNLVGVLQAHDLVDPETGIESWHMQNHPAADGSDHEAAIIFFPVPPPPNGHTPEHMQREIDRFLEITGRWLKKGG